ncbi:hypothetical protein [Pseudobacteroides cellulosolvens]|uniref:hypothetical protein n=1 Tax=Pseudobacteroides cellulosolvens TaxID=35825 RepID=UPI000565D081|nr:hypothetical protein [Pseudobacteroides cellulosolvens]
MHWPCGTTCWTIKKESQSLKWTLAAFLVPTVTGIIICFIVANTVRLLGLVELDLYPNIKSIIIPTISL